MAEHNILDDLAGRLSKYGPFSLAAKYVRPELLEAYVIKFGKPPHSHFKDEELKKDPELEKLILAYLDPETGVVSLPRIQASIDALIRFADKVIIFPEGEKEQYREYGEASVELGLHHVIDLYPFQTQSPPILSAWIEKTPNDEWRLFISKDKQQNPRGRVRSLNPERNPQGLVVVANEPPEEGPYIPYKLVVLYSGGHRMEQTERTETILGIHVLGR